MRMDAYARYNMIYNGLKLKGRKNASLSCFGTIYSPMDRHCVQVLIGAWYREQNTRGEHPSLIGHRLSPHYMIRFH